MSLIAKTLSSSIGMKLIMAVSGFLLFGFLLGHLSGNLLIYAGPDALNAYAKWLHDLGGLLWVARIGLLVAIAAHILTAIKLSAINRSSTPQKYEVKKSTKATFASRTMMMTGLIVLFFILYHLAHYTFRWLNPEFEALDKFDVYSMVVLGFKNPLASLFYIVGVGLLCFHLSHGVSSLFQTLGINHPKYNPLIRILGPAFGIILAIGYLSIPVSVLTGLVGN